MQKVQKQKSEFQKLKQIHKKWQDFISKSRVKMKKKVKKDKKEYYDFDYTRGQYYYNFPQNHINFASPDTQFAFFKDLLNQQTKSVSNLYDTHYSQRVSVESDLKPQELHDFLKDIRGRLHAVIVDLRIQKSLYIREGKAKEELLDLMEDEIRSYHHRLVRLHQVYYSFQKSLSQRLEQRTTSLKLKKFDEMHFSELQKGDFVIFLRMEGVQQRLSIQLNRFVDEFQVQLFSRKNNIYKKCYEKRGAKGKMIQNQYGERYQSQKAKIQRYFIDNEPTFFDSEDKLKQLQVFLTNLNYTKCINNHEAYLDANMCIQEVDYIPSSQPQLKQSLMSVCKNYFPKQMLQSLYNHKKQHLCYRLNYFSSIILRTIAQSYSFLIEIKEKDIHSMKNTMKRQLQTIFTNEADKLFNVAEHQIIFLVEEGSYQMDFIKHYGADQDENIFREYFRVNRMIDTFTKSIINLLSVTQEKSIKDVVDAYVLQICQAFPNKLKYLSLFFANYNNEDKIHTINLLNSKMIIGAFKQNVLQSKFLQILSQGNTIDQGLLKITYLLYAINNIQVRKELDHVINAQISILYKVKYRLSLLKHNHELPFEMTPQFLQRFTESSFSHQFINDTQKFNIKTFTVQENHDRIFWIKNGQTRQRVQIRRIIPQNPLFEGKKVLYKQAIRETDVILQKIHNLIAYLVEKRQNYLQEHSFSGIVDRFRIINKLLNLEVQYHCKKLKYMEEVFDIFEKSNSHQGIFIATDLLYSAKRKQVYYSLNQPHFQQRYINQTQLWQKKGQLLSLLKQKQIQLQQQQKKHFRENLIRSNHVNNVPQISSIYYSDQLAMDGDDNIAEDDEQDAISEDVSQSQFMMNSSKYKSDISAISSEYHVKTTFKQILGRSSVNAQAADQNKREELMGRKKKKILNDSVLGGLLVYQGCNYYRYLHKALEAVESFEKIYEAEFTKKDVGVKREYYEQVINVIRNSDQRIAMQPCLVEQNLLNRYLGDCNRAISKVVQKSKFYSAGLDDYLFMSSKLFKDILDNSTFSNLNQLRGLYTCLNMIKLSKLYPKFLRNKLLYRNLIDKIKTLCKQHSGQTLSRDFQFFSMQILNRQFQIGPFLKFIQNPTEFSPYKSMMFLANNANFSVTSFALFNSVVQYYKNITKNQCEEVFDYKYFLDNLMLMENYGSYFDKMILGVKGIENRLYIRRKIQSLNERLKQVIQRKSLQELLSLPIKVIYAMKKFQKKNYENQNYVLENIKSFEEFIEEIAAASAIVGVLTQKIIVKQRQKKLILLLQNTVKILPFCGKLVYVQPLSQTIYRQFFHEDFKILQRQNLQGQSDKSLTFEYKRISFDQLARNATRDHLFMIRPFAKSLIERKYKQFNGNRESLQKYYDYMDTYRLQDQYSFSAQSQLREIYNYKSDLNKMSNLKTWIECKLLFFGVSLSQNQLLCFRSIIKDIHLSSEVFFRDQSNKLINYQDLVKMKVEMIDGNGIIEKYKKKFLIYENLKTKYKLFLEGLAEISFLNQGREIINIIYIGEKDVFINSHKIMPNYLKQYCFQQKIKNQTTKFVDFITFSNPNRYMRYSFFTPITFDHLKSSIWRSETLQDFKQKTSFIEQRCQIIKNTLNSSNTKMKDMTEELVIVQFTRERMKDIFEYLQIPINKKSKIQYAFFLKKLQEKFLLGMEKLNQFQKFVSKFIEKILKEKPQLFALKDQIFQKIYQAKFYESLIQHKLLNLSVQALSKQLSLYSILTQNYQQKQLIRQNRIIKNTLNKVLVPKIIINPYLQSPLILQNYFFAASLKLSYVDSFLNKLKNRAIFVELAEGGFGFLLKITELDQCIQSLCKGIITFTEKEFNDRFRTFIESHQELREKYRKANNQNQNLRNIVEVCKQQWGKQIKSTIYSKLNSYLSTIHTKQKTYESIFQTIKSLQIQIAKRFDEKYQKKMKALQQQNKKLKDKFIQYKQITTKNSRTSMQQSKDYLYNNFKKEVQGILNKQIIKDYSETVNKDHQQQQQYTSTLLLKKLRTQKIFYEIRVANLQGKIKEKTNEIIKLRDQITRLDNTLTLQQYKTTKLADQIKRLFDKNIEIQDLKREIVKKQEEQALSKFKLIKINEHLQGKLGRIEEKNKSESMISVKQTKRQERNMAIQAGGSEKKQRRNFKIRTEYSQPSQPIQSYNRAEEIVLWKQKWESSERKYQILMSKVVHSYEVYRMSKNYIKLAQKIGNIFEECTSNTLIKRQ